MYYHIEKYGITRQSYDMNYVNRVCEISFFFLQYISLMSCGVDILLLSSLLSEYIVTQQYDIKRPTLTAGFSHTLLSLGSLWQYRSTYYIWYAFITCIRHIFHMGAMSHVSPSIYRNYSCMHILSLSYSLRHLESIASLISIYDFQWFTYVQSIYFHVSSSTLFYIFHHSNLTWTLSCLS